MMNEAMYVQLEEALLSEGRETVEEFINGPIEGNDEDMMKNAIEDAFNYLSEDCVESFYERLCGRIGWGLC